ncbi:MAG: response regulator [bacterium]
MGKKRVLIIEDQLLLRTIMQDVLTEEGFDVVVAKNVENAFFTIETSRVDCIITDLYMPDMDGIAFTTKLKTNHNLRHIPIIMLTSETREEIKQRALEAGVSLFIKKPATGSQIAKEIKSLLGEL